MASISLFVAIECTDIAAMHIAAIKAFFEQILSCSWCGITEENIKMFTYLVDR